MSYINLNMQFDSCGRQCKSRNPTLTAKLSCHPIFDICKELP